MRAKLVLAGLLAGVATSVAPAATAYCEPEIIVVEGGGSGGCRNSCIENGERYERLRTENGLPGPSYWDLFVCPM